MNKPLLRLFFLALCTHLLAGPVIAGPKHSPRQIVAPMIIQENMGEHKDGPSSGWVRTDGSLGQAASVLVLSEYDGKSYRLTGATSDQRVTSTQSPGAFGLIDLRLHKQADNTFVTSSSPCRLVVKISKDTLDVRGTNQSCVNSASISYDGVYTRDR